MTNTILKINKINRRGLQFTSANGILFLIYTNWGIRYISYGIKENLNFKKKRGTLNWNTLKLTVMQKH